MKSIKELQSMLICELYKHIDGIKSEKKIIYYNEILGDISVLLAGLLDSLLIKNFEDWDHAKWIDDCLLTKVEIKNHNLTILGIMIWGRNDTTEQWTDPFHFEIELLADKTGFKKITFLFCDLNKLEIPYEEFRDNREYWEVDNRNWKYIINSFP